MESARKEILEKLKEGLAAHNPENVCCAQPEIQAILNKSGIRFSGCPEIPGKIKISITGCEFLVAPTCSVLVSSDQKGGRRLFIYPPLHFIIASKKQIVNSLDEA